MYTIVHAVVGYFVLLLAVRVLSRRPGGQLTPFEFVIVFLIGGLIILATVDDDKSITNCVGATLTVCLLHRTTAYIRGRSRWVRNLLDGSPIILLNQGRWHAEAMEGMRITDDDVMATARAKGLRQLAQIRYAVLERVGTISIIPEKEEAQKHAGEDPQ